MIQNFEEKNYNLNTFEIMKSPERKLPIHSILYSMTETQKLNIEDDLISIEFLTKEQIKEIQENLLFDREIEKIGYKTRESVYKYI
ncbi:hypothetical protein H3C61_03265 [Candidatus Gracilibacteria bacterium]|nr:hypothetical protein [Candidatus Gracilibacteria bacterium]